MKKYAIVGFGCSGYRAAEALRENDPTAEIHIFSDTWLPPYNPMLTTYYAKGAIEYDALFPFGPLEEIIDDLRLIYHGGCHVEKIDPEKKSLKSTEGEAENFDAVLLATGARPFILPIPGIDCSPNIFCMRSVSDAVRFREILDSGKVRRGLVVGASMIGIKVAEAFLLRNMECVMVDTAPYIFPLAAFPRCAAKIQENLDKKGIRQRYGMTITAIEDSGTELLAHFKDGTVIHTDAIGMCVGTRANTGPLMGTGVDVNRGVVVDKRMLTNFPGVYAAGDCCEAPELQSSKPRQIGLWSNAGYQGRTAGEGMAGVLREYDYNILHNITHYLESDFFGAGDPNSCTEEDDVYEYDCGVYIRAVRGRDDDRLRCINMLGLSRCCGLLKNHLMKSYAGGGTATDEAFRGTLKSENCPDDFIEWLDRTGEEA